MDTYLKANSLMIQQQRLNLINSVILRALIVVSCDNQAITESSMLTYLSNVHDIVNGILSDKQLKFVIDETTMGKELILYNVVIDGNNVT